MKACGANIYTGLFRVTNIRFSNILHSHKPVYIFAPHADFCFEYLLTPGLTGFLRCGFLWDNTEIAIVICKDYQNMHISRRCALDMILLVKDKGMASVKANIYSFNKQSQAMFLSIGFIQTYDEWYEYRL